MHAGIDTDIGYIYSIPDTSASKYDVLETSKLLQNDYRAMYGDSGYFGVADHPEIKDNEMSSKMTSESTNNLHVSRLLKISMVDDV